MKIGCLGVTVGTRVHQCMGDRGREGPVRVFDDHSLRQLRAIGAKLGAVPNIEFKEKLHSA